MATAPVLRDYQERAITLVRECWRERPILMLPTGAGKTVVASAMIHAAVKKGRRVLFLVHRRELVRQAVTRLADWGIDAGVLAAGWKPSASPVQVASIQTLSRRGVRLLAGLVVVDECQHVRAKTWEEILDDYAKSGACTVGLSATPYRLDGRGLGHTFGRIVNPVTVQQLCDEGVLIEPRVFAPPGPDLKGVHKRGGEYVLSELAERMEKLEGNIIDHWLQIAKGMRTVVFAVDIQHSRQLVDRFNEAGVRAAHVDGTFSAGERDAVLDALAAGDLDLVSNCMVLGEGWDLPALECAVLARPTASLALHRQQIGRIMRAAPGKEGALVLDHAGNTLRHGRVTDEVEVSLDDRAKRDAALAIKTCPMCFYVCLSTAKECPECGHEFSADTERERPKESDGKLVELGKREHATQVYRDLVRKASRWGNRIGWARYKYKSGHGFWPSDRRGLGRGAAKIEADEYSCRGYEAKSRQYGGEVCGRCFRREEQHERVGLSW